MNENALNKKFVSCIQNVMYRWSRLHELHRSVKCGVHQLGGVNKPEEMHMSQPGKLRSFFHGFWSPVRLLSHPALWAYFIPVLSSGISRGIRKI